MMQQAPLILASASPRRAELLQQIGLEFTVMPADIDETPRIDEAPEAYVRRLAAQKARVISAANPGAVVLGSDTTVVAPNGEILGKPADKADARRMLRLLAGNQHQVISAVAVNGGAQRGLAASRSVVTMREISEREMSAYWRSGEPLGKAGGYAIQGLAAIFITALSGSYSAVMGLPIAETAALLEQAGVAVLAAD